MSHEAIADTPGVGEQDGLSGDKGAQDLGDEREVWVDDGSRSAFVMRRYAEGPARASSRRPVGRLVLGLAQHSSDVGST